MLLDLQPVRADLGVPEAHDRALDHDATFTAWDHTFSTLRDAVNHGIRLLNHAGAGLRELPGESLEELLVLPLTGDYGRIRQNADACGRVRLALDTWGGNFARISLGLDPRWDGMAAAAFFARMQAYDLLARALGEVVGRGAAVFEEIATVSEAIGVVVERVIVALGRLLARLARKVLEKVAGPAGWTAFAVELATKGLHAMTEIVEDVELVLSLIAAARDLRDTVREWAEVQRQRLGLFAELPALVRGAARSGWDGGGDHGGAASRLHQGLAELGEAAGRGIARAAS